MLEETVLRPKITKSYLEKYRIKSNECLFRISVYLTGSADLKNFTSNPQGDKFKAERKNGGERIGREAETGNLSKSSRRKKEN